MSAFKLIPMRIWKMIWALKYSVNFEGRRSIISSRRWKLSLKPYDAFDLNERRKRNVYLEINRFMHRHASYWRTASGCWRCVVRASLMRNHHRRQFDDVMHWQITPKAARAKYVVIARRRIFASAIVRKHRCRHINVAALASSRIPPSELQAISNLSAAGITRSGMSRRAVGRWPSIGIEADTENDICHTSPDRKVLILSIKEIIMMRIAIRCIF